MKYGLWYSKQQEIGGNTMKKIIYVFFLVSSQLHSVTKGPNVVTFFVKDYPTLHTFVHPDQSTKTNRTGIYISYFGYIEATDHEGQVTFPRSHQKPNFTLIVSTDAQPIFMIGSTVGFWQLNEGAHYACYQIEKKQDTETKRWIWNIQKSTPPKNGQLSVDTILVFADPAAIYIPEGVTLTDNNHQLVLPPVYAKETIVLSEDALKVLEVKNFFQTLNNTHKKEKLAIQTQAE